MFIKLLKKFRKDQKGSVLILVGFAATALVISTGVAIDYGSLYMLQKHLQVTADASALAAAAAVGDTGEALVQANSFASLNMGTTAHGDVLADADVIFGEWDIETKVFNPAGADINAVRVITRRSDGNGNAAPFYFGKVIGFSDIDLAASAIAMLRPGECFTGGGIAGGKVHVGSDASLSGFCMHGSEGVVFGARAWLDGGAKVSANDIDDITFGHDSTIPDDSVLQSDITPTKAQGLEQYIDDLESGAVTIDGMTNVVVIDNGEPFPEVMVEGTIYIVNSSLNINNANDAQNVLIAVRGNIQFGTGASLVNTGDIDTGDVSIGVIATGDVKFVHDGEISGVDVVAGKDIIIGQDAGAMAATLTAGDNMHIGKRAQLSYNLFDESVQAAAAVQAAVLVN